MGKPLISLVKLWFSCFFPEVGFYFCLSFWSDWLLLGQFEPVGAALNDVFPFSQRIVWMVWLAGSVAGGFWGLRFKALSTFEDVPSCIIRFREGSQTGGHRGGKIVTTKGGHVCRGKSKRSSHGVCVSSSFVTIVCSEADINCSCFIDSWVISIYNMKFPLNLQKNRTFQFLDAFSKANVPSPQHPRLSRRPDRWHLPSLHLLRWSQEGPVTCSRLDPLQSLTDQHGPPHFFNQKNKGMKLRDEGLKWWKRVNTNCFLVWRYNFPLNELFDGVHIIDLGVLFWVTFWPISLI